MAEEVISSRNRKKVRMNVKTLALILVAMVALARQAAVAEVKPAPICGEGMVLQQEMDARLWGTADPGEEVTVTFRGKKATAIAKEDGRWLVSIPSGAAGGPFELTIAGKNTIAYKNVLVGEVWLCSGQSNMDWGLNSCDESDKKYADSAPTNEMLRLFTTTQHSDAGATHHGPPGVWFEANPKAMYRFSAVGYFFGRHLQEQRKVPVGLIHASQGGARIQVFMSPTAVEPFEKPIPDYKGDPVGQVSGVYKRDIEPLLDFRIRGVIWYQGETNGGDWKYRLMLPALIEDWRTGFQNPDLAFHIVQLPLGPGWDWCRESQTLTALQGRNTGVIATSDVGGSIHPNPKRPCGDRLALVARGITYGEKIVYSGPMLKSVKYEGARAVLEFNHVDGGLLAKDMWLDPEADSHPYRGKNGSSFAAYRVKEGSNGKFELVGFSIRGEDEKYWPAQAEIVGDTVVVSSDKVAGAAGVRYGFHTKESPFSNLYNREGLPAPAFGTDGVTAPLTLSAGPGGTVSPGNTLIVAKGAPIPILATPAANHLFTGWTVLKGNAELADAKAADTTIRVFGNATLRANFASRVACTIAEPANPTLLKVGAHVTLTAKTSILQGESTIRKVEFFRGDMKIGEAGSEPYAFEWTDVPAGSHTVTARATDSTGLTATSMPVCVVATASGSWEGIHGEGGMTTYYTEGGTHWTVHTFTQSGTLRVSGAGEVEYLMVGGGGGGGGTYDGGGGAYGALYVPAKGGNGGSGIVIVRYVTGGR
jgi:sialate O-acetylesterase